MDETSPYSTLEELGKDLEERSLLDYMMENTGGDVEIPYKGGSLDEDDYLNAVLDIHFDEEYGTPYWRERAEELDFDPREEINSLQDLRKLGEADEEAIINRPVEDFMPRLFAQAERGSWGSYEDVDPDASGYDMSKSSGSTGKKKIMPWREHLSEEVAQWYNHNFEIRDIETGNWVITGPPGLYENQIREASKLRGQNAFFNGVETRRLKPQTKELGQMIENPLGFAKGSITDPGKVSDALQGAVRMKYTLQAIEEDLQSEEIGVVASVPQIVKRVNGMLESDETVSEPEDIGAVLMSGMSVDEETHQEVSNMYENAEIMPMYATSFTGANFDDPESESMEYHSMHPFINLDVIEQGDRPYEERESVEPGERGQVALNHLSSGFFWPNQTERETAQKTRPSNTLGTSGDGITDIRPLQD